MQSISAKEARRQFAKLIKTAEQGSSTSITRRGRKVAQLVPAKPSGKGSLPSLLDFRSGIEVKGKPVSATVVTQREKERY